MACLGETRRYQIFGGNCTSLCLVHIENHIELDDAVILINVIARQNTLT